MEDTTEDLVEVHMVDLVEDHMEDSASMADMADHMVDLEVDMVDLMEDMDMADHMEDMDMVDLIIDIMMNVVMFIRN